MTKDLKRALPLVGAIALVGSALMAGSGAALAGKAAPTISGGDRGFCNLSGDDARYRTAVHLDGKGRWGFVTVTLQLPSGPSDFYVDPPLKIRLAPEQDVVINAPAADSSVTMTVTVTDRNGVPVPTEHVTTPSFLCS